MDKTQIAKDIRGAIKCVQLDTLRDLLEKNPEMLEWMTPFGTWLHVASAHGHLEIVKLLVENNIDISIKYSGDNMKDMDAYAFAIERGKTEITEYLSKIR
ncbi:ankyrin repeat domain-containing protein [Paenibacillus oleatilyticus]|uniref:Ankyrin repeat domain-containing protein n=1 Tax=Paenibacillus oleatilyticus TaxID=2594886 RepID=A0ABV4V4J1_9BACL